MAASGEDINKTFTSQTSGSVYASFLVNVAAAQSGGDYFFHLGPVSIGTTFIGRIYARSTTGGIQFGLTKSNETPVTYAAGIYALNTTYLLVLKYSIVDGAGNDRVDLFISPALGGTEPPSSLSTAPANTDPSNIGAVGLRQGSGTSAASLRVDYIRVGTTWESVTSSSVTLTASPTSFTGLITTQGTASASRSFTLNGTNLSDPVSVSATANIELSSDGNTFSTTPLSITPASGSLSQVVYARIADTAPIGVFSGTITSTASATLATNVTVSGQVNDPNAPTLMVSPTTFTSLTTTEGTASGEQTYTVTATNLTEDVTVSAPAGVEISQSSGSGFGSFITLPPSTTSAVLYVRLTGAVVGPVSGTITNVSSGLTANVAVSGTVLNDPNTLISIATARASIGQTVTIEGRVTVTTQLGARQIYIQDGTGGIAVYSGVSGTDLTSVVQLGDLFRVKGPISVFNGYLEVNGVSGYTVVTGAGTVNPDPIPVTPDQLANYQGQLVSIADATITPATSATFTGGTNYTITAAGQSSTLRISGNSPLAGAGRPANPVSVTGIADRFVSGAGTTGTNGMQIQPRLLSDIPGSTEAQDVVCTIPNTTTLTRDQTLDIAAWNMEFFGADGGVITCSPTSLTYNDMGPVNEDLQQTNAVTVLNKLNADIIGVEEISDINRFVATVQAMPGSYSYICSNRFSYYFQDECTQTPTGNPPRVFGPTSLAQKVCVIYNRETITPVLAETKPLLDGAYTYPGDNGWSSGRLPFLFVADANIGGVTKRVHVVVIHAKSGSATDDYNRRVQDVADLKTLLDTNYPTANFIILGDYNDKLNGSIASGKQSSFSALINDAARYTGITLPLENQGCSTFNSSASFIDHMIVSNELQQAYVPNSVSVIQPFSVPNYGTTTSDHNPIVSRFDPSLLNSAPTVAQTIASQTATVGVAYSFTVPAATFTDTETPNSLTLSVSGLPSGLSFTAPNVISGTPSTTVGSPFTVTVVATDPGSLSVSTTFTLTVNPANNAPTVSNPIGSQTATLGVAYSFTIAANTFADAETPNSLTLSVSGLPDGLSFTAPNVISGTPSTTVGSPFTVTVVATDPGSLSVSTTFTLTIAPPPNTAPTVSNPIGSQTATVGVAYSFTVPAATFTDTETPNSLTLSVSGLPAGLSFTAPNVISGTPSTTVGSPFTITVKATDPGSLSVSTTFQLTILPPPNTPPTVAIPIPSQTATVGQLYSFNIPPGTFTDAQTPNSLTFSVSGLPAGLSFSGSSAITGTPSTTVGSPFTVTIVATDPGGLSVSTTYQITVRPAPNTAPTVVGSIGDRTASVNQAFTMNIPAVFTDTETPNGLTLSVNGLPAGLNFTAPSTISGTPSTTVGSPFTVTVVATDPGGLSVATTFQITVSNTTSCLNMFTVKNGTWDDVTVWSCGRTPTKLDPVTINHAVTLPTSYTGNALRVSFGPGGRIIQRVASLLNLASQGK
ncbi:hypothetical protein GCM10027592_02440 [Spirosoma flavus]